MFAADCPTKRAAIMTGTLESSTCDFILILPKFLYLLDMATG